MSDPELLAALGPVLRALGDLGVRHFVGGSIASSAHGVARASVGAVEIGVGDLLQRALEEAGRAGG